MKPSNLAVAAVAVVVGTFAATNAEARSRSSRSGFNFGTTVRVLDSSDSTRAGEGSDKNTKTTSESMAVNPYLGYAFGSFNLGLVYSGEQRHMLQTEESEDGLSTTERKTDVEGRGGSLFMRFMFGEVFFFEGGAGLYQEKLTVHTETKHDQGAGVFSGEEDSYQVKGTGPGYHVGAGLELQMGGGFYFTSQYQTRIVQLRDYDGGSDLGKKRSSTQKREVLFGIAYYDR